MFLSDASHRKEIIHFLFVDASIGICVDSSERLFQFANLFFVDGCGLGLETELSVGWCLICAMQSLH